jgi:hypothetical protein
MAIKHDVVARYCKNAIAAALSGASVLLLAGCASLFDSPPDKVSVHEEVALKRMEQAASFTPQSAVDKATDKSKTAAQQGSANAMKKKNPDDPESGDEPGEGEPVGWEVPQLSFERFKADMPQLTVWGLEEATFLLDGKQIELGQMTRVGRIALIAPGHRRLQVKCPVDPPFSADFYLVKDDRVVLRGRCSSGKRVVPGGGKGS